MAAGSRVSKGKRVHSDFVVRLIHHPAASGQNMKTYKVELTVTLDDGLSEAELDELFGNMDIESSVAEIAGSQVMSYTEVE